MIRRPPRSTLFPTRRSSDLCPIDQLKHVIVRAGDGEGRHSGGAEGPGIVLHDQSEGQTNRSEEHTSELQSHLNLVCRLLLEKKKISVILYRKRRSLSWLIPF